METIRQQTLPRLDKRAFSVASLFDEPDDQAYWRTRSHEERLEHIEYLRWINYGSQARARLQRFFEVVERKTS